MDTVVTQRNAQQGDTANADHPSRHVYELERTISALSDTLAGFGRATHLQELLRIIRWPGWTTPAELAFVNAIIDHVAVQVRTLDRLQADLVDAARKVGRTQ